MTIKIRRTHYDGSVSERDCSSISHAEGWAKNYTDASSGVSQNTKEATVVVNGKPTITFHGDSARKDK